MMEPQLKSRKVRITRVLPPHAVFVMADRVRLDQVLINLLRNALDATKDVEDPIIDIILAAGHTATLTVRDNGPGIEDLDSLFEPFYTTKAPGDGVGLGLAIPRASSTTWAAGFTPGTDVRAGPCLRFSCLW